MKLTSNPFRGGAAEFEIEEEFPAPSVDVNAVLALLERCPAHAQTPLVESVDLARDMDVAQVHVKDERGRMGLGSFKALGAAYVIAHDAQARGVADMGSALAGVTYVTASAGNHGLSVAAGAAVFGARAVVYIAETVPEAFAARLRDKGADVVREGAIYEDSMAAAERAAEREGWVLLSDSSWPGYVARPYRLMQGYLALMAEVFTQIPTPPSHIFLQAGVGGLAGSCAAIARRTWGDAPRIIVVEPAAAPALEASIRAGQFVISSGPSSAMGRLDCKEASRIALKGLAQDADGFALISEEEAQAAVERLAELGITSTPSGAAGIAGLLSGDRADLGLSQTSRVLVILSEGPET
ncbi:MAG: pyridoxal-phosphate dependent enzyme [Aestuariivita sp.]|uniref:pyridoxal-phosphate dependent enzyme n=1 Tax=Aestuariivita sp. TaxID=1872407 RepID=UPI003BAF7EDF